MQGSNVPLRFEVSCDAVMIEIRSSIYMFTAKTSAGLSQSQMKKSPTVLTNCVTCVQLSNRFVALSSLCMYGNSMHLF